MTAKTLLGQKPVEAKAWRVNGQLFDSQEAATDFALREQHWLAFRLGWSSGFVLGLLVGAFGGLVVANIFGMISL